MNPVSIKPSSDRVRICSLHGPDVSNVTVSTQDAPALALAILEAGGFVGDENMFTGLAVANLRDHVEEQERATAEAEAQAELEAEALGLLNAYLHSADTRLYATWEEVVEVSKRMAEDWLAVARKAREIGAEK